MRPSARMLLSVLCLLLSSSAMADWQRAGSSESLDYYWDNTRIRRSGNIISAWSLFDFKKVQEFKDNGTTYYQSTISHDDYDCTNEKKRTTSFIWYSSGMGRGNVAYSNDQPSMQWRDVTPNSVGERLLRVVCGIESSNSTSSSRNADFLVINNSSLTIVGVYASPEDSRSWGEDKLPGTIRPKASEIIRMPRDGKCVFDVGIAYDDKTVESLFKQDLCSTTALSVNGANRVALPQSNSSGSTRTPSTSTPNSRANGSFGTGFFISGQGLALTNNHVVEDCRSIVVKSDGRQYSARILSRDERNDLALISVSTIGPVQFASFRASPSIRSGDAVLAAGYPLPDLLQNGLNITVGNVSALAGLGGNTAFLQTTAPIQPGNSGGPLLDMSGNLVGVVVSKLDAARIARVTGDIPQNINFAVQGPMARLFIEAGGQRIDERASTKELPVGQVGDRARAFTFQIECKS